MIDDMRDPEVAERLDHAAPDEALRRRDFLARTAVTAGLAASWGTVLSPETLVAEAARRQRRVRLPSPRNMPLDTIVVLMMENRSFDHYLGWLPNADGRQAGLSYPDRAGAPMSTYRLPPDWQGCAYNDPDHSWEGGRVQLDGGRMDGFLRSGASDRFAVGYYAEGDLGFIHEAAKRSTAYDRFFCSLMASTFPNREYMHAAESYGKRENSLPSGLGFPDTTIFAALTRKGVSNRYFYNDIPVSALWGVPGLARSGRIEEYYARCAQGTLPQVSFVDPAFANESGGTSGDEHPFGDVRVGQAFMSDVAHAFMESRQWRRGALFIVYDEWGGFFDHVKPPRVPDRRNSRALSEDYGQMGFRIPAVALSPYLRRGYVDHGVYGFESILKLIRYRFGLGPLTRRDAYARNIGRSFDWVSDPRLTPPSLPDPPAIVGRQCANRPPGLLEKPRRGAVPSAPERPAPHDMEALVTSGYLDRLGFDYRPASPASTFRNPNAIRDLLRANPWR